MNFKKYTSVLLLTMLLGACQTSPSKLAFKVLAPIGAPSVSLARYAADAHFETVANPTAVRAALVDPNESFKAVVFDAVTGLNLITGKNAPYRLARIITAGNLYLAATAHAGEEKPQDSDVIVSFGQGNITDRLFRLVYPDLTPDYYAPGVAQAATALCSGKYEGQDVDYVVISEPYLTKTLNSTTCVAASQKYDISSDFVAYAQRQGVTLNGFPQAGLFIAQSYEAESHASEIKEVLKTVDSTLKDLSVNGMATVRELQNLDSEVQRDKFGLDADLLKSLNTDGNRLAYYAGAYDLSGFFRVLGLDVPAATAFSRYWLTA